MFLLFVVLHSRPWSFTLLKSGLSLIGSLKEEIVALVGSLAAYELIPVPTNTVKPCPDSFNIGHYNLWAGGSSADCPFNISRNGILTGAFHSNASLQFVIQTYDEYQQRTIGSIPTMYFYTSKNTTTTNLNVSLPAGSYYIEFYFIYSYTCYSLVNSTANCGYTALNITQTFLVKLA